MTWPHQTKRLCVFTWMMRKLCDLLFTGSSSEVTFFSSSWDLGHLISWRWGSVCFISAALCSSPRLSFDSNICDTSFTGEFSCLINVKWKLHSLKATQAPVCVSICKKWDEVWHAVKLSGWVQHNKGIKRCRTATSCKSAARSADARFAANIGFPAVGYCSRIDILYFYYVY